MNKVSQVSDNRLNKWYIIRNHAHNDWLVYIDGIAYNDVLQIDVYTAFYKRANSTSFTHTKNYVETNYDNFDKEFQHIVPNEWLTWYYGEFK